MTRVQRVIVTTGDFDVDGAHPWLINDLVETMCAQGAQVDVVVADPHRTRSAPTMTPNGARVLDLSPPRWWCAPLGRRVLGGRAAALLARMSCVLSLSRYGRRWSRGSDRYDAVISFSIGLLNGGLPNRLRRQGIAKRSLFVLWDFFPVHQVEIGRLVDVPPVTRLLQHLERRSFRHADKIAVMSPRNEEFLRAYHCVRQPTVVVPPWSTSGAVTGAPERYEVFTVVFGGQIVAGRDLSVLIEAARLLRERSSGPPIEIHIAGDGSGRASLEADIRRHDLRNVTLLGRLPRDTYRAHAGRCHVGVSITDFDVSVPSFPSKIPEFLGLGLPVVVACEPTTDAGQIVADLGVGLEVRSDDPYGVARAIETYALLHAAGDLPAYSQRARAAWASHFSADAAARLLLAAID